MCRLLEQSVKRDKMSKISKIGMMCKMSKMGKVSKMSKIIKMGKTGKVSKIINMGKPEKRVRGLRQVRSLTWVRSPS